METIKERLPNDDLPNAHLKIFKAAKDKWAIFTVTGDYLETLTYEDARPLIARPAARAEYLEAHGIEQAKGALA